MAQKAGESAPEAAPQFRPARDEHAVRRGQVFRRLAWRGRGILDIDYEQDGVRRPRRPVACRLIAGRGTEIVLLGK